MNPGRFFLPNSSMYVSPLINARYFPNGRGLGLLSRITNSIKSFNWSGLLNGANKTLNVVNQTIPLVRQAGPMVNNMKSMFKIAKVFGNETGYKNHRMNANASKLRQVTPQEKIENYDDSQKKEVMNNNYPNFFI